MYFPVGKSFLRHQLPICRVAMLTTVDPSDVIMMASSIMGELMAGNSMSRRDATKVVLKRLVRQLPPHDCDSRHCSSLRGEDEQSVMDEFVETRVRTALGRGLVQRWSGDDRTPTSCHQVLDPCFSPITCVSIASGLCDFVIRGFCRSTRCLFYPPGWERWTK